MERKEITSSQAAHRKILGTGSSKSRLLWCHQVRTPATEEAPRSSGKADDVKEPVKLKRHDFGGNVNETLVHRGHVHKLSDDVQYLGERAKRPRFEDHGTELEGIMPRLMAHDQGSSSLPWDDPPALPSERPLPSEGRLTPWAEVSVRFIVMIKLTPSRTLSVGGGTMTSHLCLRAAVIL